MTTYRHEGRDLKQIAALSFASLTDQHRFDIAPEPMDG